MKWVFILLLLLGLGYGGYRLWQYDQIQFDPRSKQDDMRVVLGGRDARNPTGVPTGETKYQGNYITFTYPAKAIVMPGQKPDGSILDRVSLMFRDPRLDVVVVAMKSEEKTLDEVPAVTMRRGQRDVYDEKRIQIGQEFGLKYSRLDGTEKVLFLLHDGRLYTLSIVGNNVQELDKLWNVMLPDFHFL